MKDSKRPLIGLGWGVVATVAMSVLMVLGVATGLSPMPSPVPAAIMSTIFGGSLPQPLLVFLAAGSHLAFGGFGGAALASLTSRVTIWKALGLGIVLWLFMEIAVLPFLGWGPFGLAITPRIAVATLVLHLVYGLTLGLLMDRGRR